MKIHSINTYTPSAHKNTPNQGPAKPNFGAKINNLKNFVKLLPEGRDLAKEIARSGCQKTEIDWITKKNDIQTNIVINSPIGKFSEEIKDLFNNPHLKIRQGEKKLLNDIVIDAAAKGKLNETATDLKTNYPELSKYINQNTEYPFLKSINNESKVKMQELISHQEEKAGILAKYYGIKLNDTPAEKSLGKNDDLLKNTNSTIISAAAKGTLAETATALKANNPELSEYINQNTEYSFLKTINNESKKKIQELISHQEEKAFSFAKYFGLTRK